MTRRIFDAYFDYHGYHQQLAEQRRVEAMQDKLTIRIKRLGPGEWVATVDEWPSIRATGTSVTDALDRVPTHLFSVSADEMLLGGDDD